MTETTYIPGLRAPWILLLLALFLTAPLRAQKEEPPPITCGSIFAKYPFLREGTRPDFVPELVITRKPLDEVVHDLLTPDAVVLADFHNYTHYKGNPQVLYVPTNSPQAVEAVLADPKYQAAKRIIGMGGSAANDVAKAVAVGKPELYGISTILSTNCLSTNRSVVGSGLDSISFLAATPIQTFVSITDLLAQPKDVLVLWTSSGLGDYFAAISAAIDIAWNEGRMTKEAVRALHPDVFRVLEWIAGSDFAGYDEESLIRIAGYLHDSSLKDIELMTNLDRIGGEHALYRLLTEQVPDLRFTGATHGEIVAVGTLLNARIFGELTGDTSLYDLVRRGFRKLNLPLDYQRLHRIRLSDDRMKNALSQLALGETRKSLLTHYFETGDFKILDRVFGETQLVE